MGEFVPLRVSASLEAGVGHAAPWGVALDGLLASVLHSQAKVELEDAGGVHVPVLECSEVADLVLPLARCELGGGQLWHWAATSAWPSFPEPQSLEVRSWYSFPDHQRLEELASSLPQHVDDDRGRWRRYAMPLLVSVADLGWQAVGAVDEIRGLLEQVGSIGKKRAHGQGRVLSWSVEAVEGLSWWEAGHLHPGGQLGRPSPAQCLAGCEPAPVDGGVGRTGLRPPYLHPCRQRELHRPVLWHTSS